MTFLWMRLICRLNKLNSSASVRKKPFFCLPSRSVQCPSYKDRKKKQSIFLCEDWRISGTSFLYFSTPDQTLERLMTAWCGGHRNVLTWRGFALQSIWVNKVLQAVQDKAAETSFANNGLRELSALNKVQLFHPRSHLFRQQMRLVWRSHTIFQRRRECEDVSRKFLGIRRSRLETGRNENHSF